MIDLILSNALDVPIAYIDAGSGSLLLQAAVAGFLTASYFVKTQWAYVKALFGRGSKVGIDREISKKP